jgi:hypothetical protein
MTGSSEFQQICLSAGKGGDKPVCITRAEAEHRQQDREAFYSAILLSGEMHEIPWRLKKTSSAHPMLIPRRFTQTLANFHQILVIALTNIVAVGGKITRLLSIQGCLWSLTRKQYYNAFINIVKTALLNHSKIA